MEKVPLSISGRNDDFARVTAQLRADHRLETSSLQRGVDRLTAVVGMPGFTAALLGLMMLWIVGNLGVHIFGGHPLDPPPFAWLQGVTTTGALFVAILILTTQLRKDKLSAQREQLLLELAILSDQKSSKIIALMEEARRDNPRIVNRTDDEADALSIPIDHQSVMEAIKED